jgi:hypothetical protein
VIGTGTRLDNLVQVAHNVRIGRHCAIAAQVGISGSAEIGDFVVIRGQAGVADHIRIGSKTHSRPARQTDALNSIKGIRRIRCPEAARGAGPLWCDAPAASPAWPVEMM